MQNFQDKVAVITGGASGFGLAVAKACAREGMKLVLADIEQDRLDAVAAEFSADGVETLARVVDVSKLDQIQALAQATMDRFGGVHFLFNNAGVGAGTTTWETTIKDWDWVIGVNLMGVIYGVQTFTPLMLAQDEECHIVNTASIAGLLAGPTMAPYRVTKHAVVALSETLYLELEQMNANVSVSVLCPAWVKTGIHKSQRNRPSDLKNDVDKMSDNPLINKQLMGAVIAVENSPTTPDDIADAVMDATRNNRFYILTHPKFEGGIAIRMKDILAHNNPTNLMLPRKKK